MAIAKVFHREVKDIFKKTNELQEKYELSRKEIERGLENAIFQACKKSRIDVDVWIEEGRMFILQNDSSNNRSYRKVIKNVRAEIVKELTLLCALKQWKEKRALVKKAVWGEIIKITENGDLLVSVAQNIEGTEGASVVAVCKTASQTPKERGWYKVGFALYFYVLSVVATWDDDVPRVNIYLSRNSKGLIEELLKQELYQAGIAYNSKIACRRRIAGAYSEVEVHKPLPKEIIFKVSNLVGERIKANVKRST